MEKLLDIFNAVKSDFCELTTYKVRANSVEIITPFSTLNNKFVSVFVKDLHDQIIVSDGGWIDLNYYEVSINEESEAIIDRVSSYYQQNYQIKSTADKTGTLFYYKSCKNKEDISSAVFDLSNFIVGVVNALGITYKDEKEEKEKETFRQDANSFLLTNYKGDVQLRKSLDDYTNIKFNAIISKNSAINLITYVTGSTPFYFENALSKTIVNFEISQKSKYNSLIKEKISIINDLADGYHPEKSGSILNLLAEKTSREPVKWTEKEKILDFI
ncbi:hypothetical protein [Mariniflexile sp. AS56]|uniref:hypothetical protein n=1 Tax=Mariniflexile sp. AS56 TaxID=3063957 RepID=UPI0026E9BBE8|nr:hypothetical protein [Mariniflexile sp. AS56]MDO7170838.1 hypothetical protein [Mariniflexile sp. AS56]